MSVQPKASVDLGNLRYGTHIERVRVELAMLPAVGSFRVRLPAGVEVSAAPGDTGKLVLEGPDGSETVLTGKVRSLRRRLSATEVVVADAAADLGRLRPAATYQAQDVGAMVKALAADAGAEVGSIEGLDLELAAYVAHQRWTAAQHVAYLAELAGAWAACESGGGLSAAPWPDEPELALLYGREIERYESRLDAPPEARELRLGSGPGGAAGAPDALRHTLAALPADADAPGPGAVRRPVPVLRTPDAALIASAAADGAGARRSERMVAEAILLPALRPGVAIEVQELPNGASGGPWVITRVTHRFGAGVPAATRLWGESAGAGGGSLLDQLLSAVGGLL